METSFLINGKEPIPHLGIVEGFIQEGINQVSTIELVLVSSVSLSHSDCSDYIGANITLGIGDVIDGASVWSRFDGVIYEFHVMDLASVEVGVFKYQMIIRPKMWDLNFMVRARSFQESSRIEVVEDLLGEYGFVQDHDYKTYYFKDKIYPRHTQILQNHTSDLVFLQNLLKEAGINYFFCADKCGDSKEFLKLSDNNVFFAVPFRSVIPYNPDSGLIGTYKIDSFETHYRASTGTAYSLASLGDGSTRVYTAQRRNHQGYNGTFCSFNYEGQNEQVAVRDAERRMQYLLSNSVTYEGRSNHYAIRPGEKFKIGDAYGNPDQELLMTFVCHCFRQTPSSALAGDNHPQYINMFRGVRKCSEFRPDQTSYKTIAELRRLFTHKHAAINGKGVNGKNATNSNTADLEKVDLERRIAELQQELIAAKSLHGLMVGEVIEDAKITEHKELVCKVKNERFPEGLTIKVALGWLTQQGSISLLPRVGAQVYFQFINGDGGQNEAVLVGYRPTAACPSLNPTETINSTELKPGKVPELGTVTNDVVGSDTFSPANKHRNTLMAEGAVAEVAVIDGGEDSVYLHANNRICAVGDKSVSIATKSFSERAGTKSQQIGSLNTGVTKNQKVSVGEDFERYVGRTTCEVSKEDIFVQSQEGKVEIVAKSILEFTNKEFSKVRIDDDSVRAQDTSGKSYIELTPDGVTSQCENATLKLTKGESAIVKYISDGLEVDSDHAILNSGNAVVLDLRKSGEVVLKGVNITVEGQSVTIKGDTEVSISSSAKVHIEGGGGTVDVSGGMVKLNG